MAAVQWPVDWPLLMREKTLRPVAPFISTQFETGRSRNRRWFTAVPVHFDGVLVFKSQAMAAEFPEWFRDDIEDGVIPFEVPILSSVGKTTELVKFRDMYTEQVVTDSIFRFTLPLEILLRPEPESTPTG